MQSSKQSKTLGTALLDNHRFGPLMKERNGHGEGKAAWSGGRSRR